MGECPSYRNYQWYDCSKHAGRDTIPAEAPIGKGKRKILHAGYEGVFLLECSLVFVGKTNSADYHDEMNGDHLEEWFEHNLLLNLPAGAAIVVENAPYHTVKAQESWAPTSKTRKADMQVWLTKHDIHWTADMLKSERIENKQTSLSLAI